MQSFSLFMPLVCFSYRVDLDFSAILSITAAQLNCLSPSLLTFLLPLSQTVLFLQISDPLKSNCLALCASGCEVLLHSSSTPFSFPRISSLHLHVHSHCSPSLIFTNLPSKETQFNSISVCSQTAASISSFLPLLVNEFLDFNSFHLSVSPVCLFPPFSPPFYLRHF